MNILKIKKTALSVFLLMNAFVLFAHSGQIKGTVTDSISGKPVENANIIIESSPWAAVSNQAGEFVLNQIPEGEYVLAIMHLSYTTKKIKVLVKNGEITLLHISLQISSFSLAETSIIGNKEPDKVLTRLNLIDIELRPVNSSQDVLRIVPGLVTAQHAGGGKAEQIFLRGVDNDHGTDFNISVDGVPVNMVSHAHGQGYADLHFLIPELIKNIEFNKGPYYAEKGNFATTGYANFKTFNVLHENMLKIEGGNFNTKRLVAMIDLLHSKSKSQNLYMAAEYLYSDAYFESPQLFKRINLFAKYGGKVSDNSYLNVTVSTFNSSWNHSGQIPDRAVKNAWISRFGSIDDSEGGFTGRRNINAQISTSLTDKIQVKNQVYYTDYDFQLWSDFTFFLNDTVNGDQIMQKEKRSVYGYKTKATIFSDLANFTVKSDIGLGVRNDLINNDQLLHTYKRNTILDTISIGDVNETNLYTYYKGDIKFSDKISMGIGLRYDYFMFQYNDNTQTEFSPHYKNSGIFSPKLSIFYKPANDLQIYLKAGSGFHSNDSRLIALQKVDKDLPKAVGADLGSFFKLFDKLFMNVAAWTMYMEQEFVYVGDEAVVEPKGETMRYGADVSIRFQLADKLFFDADYNYSYGYFIDLPDGQNYIPLAPVHTSMGGLSYKSARGINASIRYRYTGNRPANEDNSVVAIGYFLTDLAVSYKWKNMELFSRVDNLFNVEWNEAQFDTETRLRAPDAQGNFTGQLEPSPVSELHYTPGSPLSIHAGAIFRF